MLVSMEEGRWVHPTRRVVAGARTHETAADEVGRSARRGRARLKVVKQESHQHNWKESSRTDLDAHSYRGVW